MNKHLKPKANLKAIRAKVDPEREVHTSRGNVFADLGVSEPEKYLAKAELARRIGAIIRKSGWDQSQAARKLQIDQPKVSNLVRGKLTDFSIERLMDLLSSLDQDVLIVVRPAERHGHGSVHVVNEDDKELVPA